MPLYIVQFEDKPNMGELREKLLKSHFECKPQGTSRFRPFYLKAINGGTEYKDYSKTPKGLLGQTVTWTFQSR